VLPDPVREHYVVVRGRRYPPKQVLACVTGLDQADFTRHEARRIRTRVPRADEDVTGAAPL